MKKIKKILLDWTDFLGHPVVFKFVEDNKIHILNISCGIPPKGNDREKLKDAIEANGKSCNKTTKFSPFFSRFLRLSCYLWNQFSQLLKLQFGKFLCPSHREFPEFLKNHPTFISSPFQSGVIAKNKIMRFFWDTL